MGYQYKFERILSLKEREKEEAQSAYQDSIKKFELVAEKLYDFLKKKEDLLSFQEQQLKSGFQVQEIRHYQNFITNLEKSISYYQNLVIQARNRMNWYEDQLASMNIEVKKYEKIREKDYKQFLTKEKEDENKQLDEVSVLQYMNKGMR